MPEMTLSELVHTIVPVVTSLLGAWLTYVFTAKQRDREDKIRQAQELRVEELRRESQQFDWLANEHRRLVYDTGSAAFALRNSVAVLAGGATESIVDAQAKLGEFQDTSRRAKLLASVEFDNVCTAAGKCLVTAFVSGANVIRKGGGIECAEDRQQAWEAVKRFDDELWPELVVAVRGELRRGVTLEGGANPLV
jgi:hypothetical protein